VVWLVIAIGIWTDLDIPAIWRQVVGSLRSLLLVMGGRRPPCKAALSQARSRLGASCLRQLFLRTAAPIAGDRTRGAFYRRMRLVHLRSRTPCGILQEIYGVLVAYNAVRFLIHEAALSVDIDSRRLSFIHAVRVLRETAPLLRAALAARLPTLYAGMIAHIAQGRLPPRDNRVNPRVIKKKMSNFPKKRAEHYRVQHPQTSFEQAVRILK